MPPSKGKVSKAKVSKAKAKTSKAKVSKAKAKTSKAKTSKAKVPKAKVSKAKVSKAKTSKAKTSKTKVSKAKSSPAKVKATKAKVKAATKGKIKAKVLAKIPRSMTENGTKAKVSPKAKVKKSAAKKTSPKSKVKAKASPKAKVKAKAKKTKISSPVVRISPVLKAKSPKPKMIPSKISAKKPCIERSNLTLKQHQIRVINHLRKHRGLIACHAVGSGKTLTAVTASQCYLDDNPNGEVIIVTPVSLQENMKKEMRAYGFDPDKDPRYKFFTIQKFATTYKGKTCKKAMLIIDEAHELRTEIPGERKKKSLSQGESPLKQKTSRAGVAVKCAGTADKVLLLTATAVYNKPQDMANLVAMAKGIDPPGKTEFQKILDDPASFKNFFNCVLSFYDIPKDDNYPIFEEHYEEIEMSPAYYAEYRAVEEQNSHLFDQRNPWKFLTGVRQASNALTDCMKCDVVLKRAQEGKKMVIYSAFLSYGVRKVQELFNENKIRYVEVNGTMKKDARDQAVKDYNANKVDIMFITKAGGQGLDLKGTRYIVIMESAWNKATENQVFGRAARYKSHTHLPKNEQKVDAYHLLIVKPPVGKSGRNEYDTYDSADTMIKEKMEEKDIQAIEFLKRLYPLSIEQVKCD
jgi:superfamily II DNA or RNA helicase